MAGSGPAVRLLAGVVLLLALTTPLPVPAQATTPPAGPASSSAGRGGGGLVECSGTEPCFCGNANECYCRNVGACHCEQADLCVCLNPNAACNCQDSRACQCQQSGATSRCCFQTFASLTGPPLPRTTSLLPTATGTCPAIPSTQSKSEGLTPSGKVALGVVGVVAFIVVVMALWRQSYNGRHNTGFHEAMRQYRRLPEVPPDYVEFDDVSGPSPHHAAAPGRPTHGAVAEAGAFADVGYVPMDTVVPSYAAAVAVPTDDPVPAYAPPILEDEVVEIVLPGRALDENGVPIPGAISAPKEPDEA